MKLIQGGWAAVVLAVCLVCGSVSTYAKKNKTNRGVYIFGVSDSFSDSTVYVTEVQSLDFVRLNSKSAFLPMRSSFSYQLKNYFESKKNMPNRLCAVYFNVRRDKLERELNKVKKNYLSLKGYKIESVPDFKFEKPAGFDDVQLTPEQEKAAKQKAKQEQKELKQKQKEAKKNRKKGNTSGNAPEQNGGESVSEHSKTLSK